MYRNQFDDFARELSTFYGIKGLIGDERATLWFEQAEYINAEALNFISERIKNKYDNIPRNLPKVMAVFYREWSENSRGKHKQQEIQSCDDCHGVGLLFPYLLKDGEFRYYKVTYACGNCENWKRHFDTLDMRVGYTNEIKIPVNRKLKSEIEAMSNFAGFDGNMKTLKKVRELNSKMRDLNSKKAGNGHDEV